MVEVLLDGKPCRLWEGYDLPKEAFGLDVKATANVASQREGRSLRLHLPSSPENDELLMMANDPCAGERFNSERHQVEILSDGVRLLKGVAVLEAMEYREGSLSYRIKVRTGGGDWVDSAARTQLAEALEYSARLDGDTIIASWGNDQKVRFLPVCYDDYRVPYDESSLYPPQRVMTVADYYPFLSIYHLIEAAAKREGYALAGDWVKSNDFKRLMMSGRYVQAGEASVTRLKNFAGFEAGRTSTATAQANALGRVWLTSQVLTSSLGNVVQTTEGEGLYCNNDSLEISTQGGVVYHPATTQTVGFEYYLKYTTDYRIVSKTRLKCFDSVYLGEGCDIELQVANPFVNMRTRLRPNMEYVCMVFDHEPGSHYRLISYGGSTRVLVDDVTDSSFRFSTPMSSVTMIGQLQKIGADGVAKNYTGEWAVYEGHVSERGQTVVEMTVQSPPEVVTPSGKVFNQLYLHGAEQGQTITLSAECRMRPVFTTSPAFGSMLGFKDVAAHNMRLIEVVEAVQQMYNLRIYTDEAARRVYIMPRDEFYRGDEHDWSAKVDLSEPIEVEDMALGEKDRFTLAYRMEGDGAVNRFNSSSESPFGEWTTEIASRATSAGERRRVNPIFSPTISSQPYANIPNAWVMQVGDRDADQVGVVSARVVRYEGMSALATPQVWGYPSFGQQYPLAGFYVPNRFTLGFENRDQIVGLHKHYDAELTQIARRCRVRLTLKLTPLEFASLAEWESDEANLRSTFVLNLSGQRATYYLEAVEAYDVTKQSALCRFVRTEND